jgi:hypothetical protein
MPLRSGKCRGQSFGGAVQPTFIQEKIQEKQDLGTEQFADLLLNEALAWSRNGTQPRQEDDITMRVIDIHGVWP